MTLSELETALKAVCTNTYPLSAPEGVTEYVVYSVYNKTTEYGDNRTFRLGDKVQVDAFTQDVDYDSFFAGIMDALDTAGVVYTVEGIAWDEDSMSQRMTLQMELV